MQTKNRVSSEYMDVEFVLALMRAGVLGTIEPREVHPHLSAPDFDPQHSTIHGTVRGCETEEIERRCDLAPKPNFDWWWWLACCGAVVYVTGLAMAVEFWRG